uniref:Uncharacterized protein n=1 Tax=Amphimedon queenslandica TaxID=400682 RepID=A0A1X7VB25_AMPQE
VKLLQTKNQSINQLHKRYNKNLDNGKK